MFPFDDFAEPEFDFFLSVCDGVWAVADVSAGDDGVVSADGSGVGSQGVGGSEQEAPGGDDTGSFPDHADDGAWEHVVDQGGEEGSGIEVGIVFFKESLGGGGQLEGSKVVTFLFETGNDGSD